MRLLSGYGIPQDQIAAEIGVSLHTLERHYRADLDEGIRKANSLVVQNLHRQATKDSPNAVTAAIWWTKSRMQWREKHDIDVTVKRDPAELSDADLARVASRGSARTLAAPDDPEEPDGVVH